MTLDDIEKMAISDQHLTDPADPYPAETVGQYARAILAMLPVVRAAEKLTDSWTDDPELIGEVFGAVTKMHEALQ